MQCFLEISFPFLHDFRAVSMLLMLNDGENFSLQTKKEANTHGHLPPFR